MKPSGGQTNRQLGQKPGFSTYKPLTTGTISKKTSILTTLTKNLAAMKSKPKTVEKDLAQLSPDKQERILRFNKETMSPINYRSQAHIPVFLPKGYFLIT